MFERLTPVQKREAGELNCRCTAILDSSDETATKGNIAIAKSNPK